MKERIQMAAVIKKLKTNRKILLKILAGQPAITIPRETLLQKGFDVNSHTSCKEWKGKTWTMCFEPGYHFATDDKVQVRNFNGL